MKKQLTETIKAEAKKLGFYKCGIAEADALPEESLRLREWLQKGRHGEMAWMENHFDKRTDPRKLLEGARSVIVVLFNYYPEKEIPADDNYKISKYAYGTDYHYVIKDKLKILIEKIKSEAGEIHARPFVDSAPVLERSWASRAGLGWIGKNTCLITKEQGSYFFIGEIITDLELVYDQDTVPNHCGGCTRCIDACPTGALDLYGLNSNACISYQTIEYRGDKLLEENPEKFQDWIFGCDICQDVCPWNRLSETHHEPAFQPMDMLMSMRKHDWENLSEIEYKELFKKSPVMRTKFQGLKRNIEFLKDP
jgi:epoxyqueuosine reductase